MIHFCIGCMLIGISMIRTPNTHFGEDLFGVKLVPWCVCDAILAAVGGANIYHALVS